MATTTCSYVGPSALASCTKARLWPTQRKGREGVEQNASGHGGSRPTGQSACTATACGMKRRRVRHWRPIQIALHIGDVELRW